MTEEQAKLWMNSLVHGCEAGPLPDSEQIWMLAQLDAAVARQRKAEASLLWVEVAVRSASGVALAGLALWVFSL